MMPKKKTAKKTKAKNKLFHVRAIVRTLSDELRSATIPAKDKEEALAKVEKFVNEIAVFSGTKAAVVEHTAIEVEKDAEGKLKAVNEPTIEVPDTETVEKVNKTKK